MPRDAPFARSGSSLHFDVRRFYEMTYIKLIQSTAGQKISNGLIVDNFGILRFIMSLTTKCLPQA
jgi:hypothetical protein